jgi:hypothetical protein
MPFFPYLAAGESATIGTDNAIPCYLCANFDTRHL